MKTIWRTNIHGETYDKLSTLTVKELQEVLSRYPDDMAVFATWEGLLTAFRDAGPDHTGAHYDYVKVEPPGDAYADECQTPCLIFNVDE